MDLSTDLKNRSHSELQLDIVRSGSRQACREKLQALRDEFHRLEVQIQRLETALAPYNKLPPEILRRIFELCCEEPAQIPAQNGGIYTVSHVCSLWRQIALSTPEFWANVSINHLIDEDQLQIAEQWFSRAGNHPRSLKFKDPGYYNASEIKLGEFLLRNLVMQYPCRELYISLPHSQVTPLKELLNVFFSGYLEALDIDCSRTLWERETVWAQRWSNLFAPTTRLTKLRHVRLVGNWNCRHLMTVIPWNQLQYLTLLLWIPSSHCLDILSECASLVRCRISVEAASRAGSVATSSARRLITLPALRVLRLLFRASITRNEASHCVEQLIRFLSVPRLSHLTLGQKVHTPYSANLGAPAICELLQRSNGMPDLVSLDLGVTSSTPIDLRALLTMTPRLRLLHVRTGIFDEEVRNNIATGTLVPQLRAIMTEVRHEAIDILRMVELRHQNATMTLIDNTEQVTEFSSITFSCQRLYSQYSVFRERLESLKKAAPRLSINLSFD